MLSFASDENADLQPRTLIRGTGLAPLLPFIDMAFGAKGRETFASSASKELIKAISEPFIAAAWYPFDLAMDAADALVALAGHPRILREQAAYSLDYATNVVFRAIFKLGSPEFMVARSDQVWRKYYSRGRMTCTASKGHATVELHSFPSLRLNYDRTIQYGIEAVLVKAGAKNVIAKHPRCVVRGDTTCVFDFEWR